MQEHFFAILEEFFEKTTGCSVTKFASLDSFGEAVRRNGQEIARRGEGPYQKLMVSLREYYSKQTASAYSSAKALGGTKLVIGGGSRFTRTHFDSVRKMLLYTDTILIPDPVLPWVEREREEERFRHVLLLENVFMLLHLKPIVDAHLQYPAVFVFPSWEKSLEDKDEVTKNALNRLCVDFFSFYLGKQFESVDEVLQYVRTAGNDFLRLVGEKRLFIAPEGSGNETISESVNMYRASIRTWRSEEHVRAMNAWPDGDLVWNGIYERLVPQFHVLENADTLIAQPMFCIPSHWHYYSLCANMYQGRLLGQSLLRESTVSTLRSLNRSEFQWLGNVPMSSLVELRKNNANEEFRKRLGSFTDQLHDAKVGEIDRVAAEVGRGITSLINEHQKDIKQIQAEYRKQHTRTAVGGWLSLAAMFIPSLAPFIGATAPIALGSKYIYDKADEARKRRESSRSLMGILAQAKKQ
jgi:hypothetical protein